MSCMATKQKIRYSDCDPQGIVFNGNYARYWDDAMTDWFDDLETTGPALEEFGIDVVTARLEIDFKASATLRDVLETSIEVESVGNTSFVLLVVTTKESDQTIVATGKLVVVCVDRETFRPTPVPEAFRGQIQVA